MPLGNRISALCALAVGGILQLSPSTSTLAQQVPADTLLDRIQIEICSFATTTI